MVKTKGIERTVANWKQGAAGATGRYSDGIKATTDWHEKALASEDFYIRRVTEAANARQREKGLRASSNAEWQKNASEKGPGRWQSGISAAEGDYRKGVNPVLTVIEGVVLPEKTGDARTDTANRAGAIAEALQKAKREGRL